MPSYDYPFNERIRTLLRVEDLFAKVLYNSEAGHEFHHHCALLTLLQILDVVDRADLKSDLLQELERQKTAMRLLVGNPAIVADALASTLSDIEIAVKELRTETSKFGQTLRANEWLMSIKQRAGILGGVCEFDVPSYHYWLGLGEDRRKSDLDAWLRPLIPMQQAIIIILRILRGSGATSKLMATSGAYQQMLGGAKPAQMLKIELADSLTCFPEVSANKYAINIRFNTLDCTQKPQKYEDDVPFLLTLCNL
ncbi:MAG: cell division protein ZapD [Methylotenera sp.]|nr:cell division protein ZapD [Methylotenera sp.]MDO9232005.1 cell division protein ZapD [Methylotenera sp.]MDO9389292.1 cell division protein ZapD [Methylotenera sp.]MDP1596634.1 cell division protein ZapD [Methylotenera sp.]MDP1755427.1 cell division protein ZapD [Methylotenera sp.]